MSAALLRSGTLRRAREAGRRAASYVGDGMLEALWPTRCVGCDLPGTLLCPDCERALPAIEQRYACPRCGAPFGSLVCTECTRCYDREDDEGLTLAEAQARDAAPPQPAEPFDRLDGLRCFGVHAWPLDRLIRAYKDGGERRCADLLAELLARALREADVPASDVLTFVPCTPEAYARRGFDHMEKVARGAGERLGLPVRDVLARRSRRDQRGLSRSRRAANADGSVVALEPLDGARVLLVDDVVTTGATLAASARALREAGAARVQAATVARAW